MKVEGKDDDLKLPTHHEAAEFFMNKLGQRFGQDICPI
jgi:hypothetical protein